ncbi:MAG: hypothetical protein K2P81_07165 [Bacteriovoracaceae bacterium]|nr:hypothetical protein [Bacteriovoracaceae bacterium]
MIKYFLSVFLFINLVQASEINTRYQYWWLKGPEVKSWRQDLAATIDMKSKTSLLIQASHFERFQQVDRIALLGFRHKTESGTWEFTHADGGTNRILAIRDTQLTHYRALVPGLGGWINLRAQGFHTNDVHMLNMGLEKEWAQGWFLIPSMSAGKATYNQPAATRNIWGSQLRIGRYQEDNWKAWIFGALGEEAQALASLSQTKPLKVKSYGLGVEKNILNSLRFLIQLERSYYPSINTRFESVMGQLTWNWGQR